MKGESVEQRRVEYLTEGNVTRWMDGWEAFLVKRNFGELKRHPQLKKEMVYVPAQKRARIINPDEMKSEMTTELESGGPRSLVYIDTSLGAPQRSKVVNPRHITQMQATTGKRKVLPTSSLTRRPRRRTWGWMCAGSTSCLASRAPSATTRR